MNVIVNGSPSDVPVESTVADVVGEFVPKGRSEKGVAVAVNGEVVARSRWAQTRVAERDRIEILAAIQGG